MCQTPNRHTDYDFWSMVIDKKVQAIVGFVAKQDFDSPEQTMGNDITQYYAYNGRDRRKRKMQQTSGSKTIQVRCLRKAYLPPDNWHKPRLIKLYTDRVTINNKEKEHEDRYKRRVLFPMPVRFYNESKYDIRDPDNRVCIHAAQCVRVHKLRVYVKENGIKRTIFHFVMIKWQKNTLPNMRRLFVCERFLKETLRAGPCKKLVNAVNKFGGTVVVHSPGGNGRAPMFCAIGLMTRQLLFNKPMSNPVKLINKISKRCPGVLMRARLVFIVICAMFYFTLQASQEIHRSASGQKEGQRGSVLNVIKAIKIRLVDFRLICCFLKILEAAPCFLLEDHSFWPVPAFLKSTSEKPTPDSSFTKNCSKKA